MLVGLLQINYHLHFLKISSHYNCSWMSRPRKIREITWSSFPQYLVSLSLVDCNLSNDAFPKDFSQLSLLRSLNLSKNPICSLPDCIRDLSSLQALRLNSCTRLKSLLQLPRLEKLFVGHCTFLEKITFLSPLFRQQQIEHTGCAKLVYVEGMIKLEPMGISDVEMIDHWSFINFKDLADVEINIFVPVKEIPDCFSIKSRESSTYFTVPSVFYVKRLNLNICSIYVLSGYSENQSCLHPLLSITLSNKSKNLCWKYNPTCFGRPEENEDMMWLSHWKVANLLGLEDGDEVTVSVIIRGVFELKEFGINLGYEQEGKKGIPGSMYPSNQDVARGHYSVYQVKTGVYFLSNEALSWDDVFLPTPILGWDAETRDEIIKSKQGRRDCDSSRNRGRILQW
ncbi:unnamed protein product [Ilex paraguariensis]|uniref:Uncharacterized protein n=1 Tax=Ilex paraguariensis TaxID=185542 RepID=A0ABC8U7E8_9AQUA